MTHLTRGDADLHDENGEHISTPPTANGHQLELYEARLRKHLETHAALDALAEVERRHSTIFVDKDGGPDKDGKFTVQVNGWVEQWSLDDIKAAAERGDDVKEWERG